MMVEAVENWDAEVAGRVVGSDVPLKGRGAEIAEKYMLLQARLPETIVLIEGAGPETLGVQCDVF